MNNMFDYYYLVLLRWYGRRLDYRATGLMTLTFAMNLFSLVILFDRHIVEQNPFCSTFSVFGLAIMLDVSLDIIYSKKRRERIIEKYKLESRASRQRGVLKVVLYEALSLALLIWTFSLLVPRP